MDPVNPFRLHMRQIWAPRVSRYSIPVVCCITSLFHPATAADEQSLEYQVKAAFVLNFTKFTEWPSSAFPAANSPFAICILGEDPFGGALDQIIQGEAIGGHRMAVQRIKRGSRPQGCQVLFIGQTEKDTGMVLADLGAGVLTVGEGDSFLRDGGMISFIIENRRTRFDINLAAAENAGLKLSSRLLSVARSVKP
jgi:hypothetical protein